jgi:Mg2+ and Co2+ transporter CorA
MYRSSVQNLESFSAWLNEERPAWSSVRWIHCPNLSLGFLKACALKYDLHNLAVEDCLHSGHVRAKADYYIQHLFLSLPIQTVRPVLSIPADNTLYELGKDVESGVHASTDSLTRIPDAQMASIKAAIRSVTEESHIGIQTDVLCVFLLKDGTVVSMTRDHDSTHLLKPIFERLASKGTILRESEDPSMLLQALLDLIVDHLLDIGDAFEKQLTILEGKVMVNPDTDAVRDLHILSAELSTLRRSLKPLQTGSFLKL